MNFTRNHILKLSPILILIFAFIAVFNFTVHPEQYKRFCGYINSLNNLSIESAEW